MRGNLTMEGSEAGQTVWSHPYPAGQGGRKVPKNTKKSERAALLKARRRIYRKMAAHRKAKRPGPRSYRTHPHRRTSNLRARKRA